MTSVGPCDRAVLGIDHGVDDREQLLVPEGQLVTVEQRQCVTGRPMALAAQRERARQGPQLPHRRGGADAPAGYVADDDAEPAVRYLERVVPVPAHLHAEAGDLVGGGQLDAVHLGQALGDQPTLKLDRDEVLLVV